MGGVAREHGDVRVGDTERDRAIALLGEHMSAGRLELTEFDDRCARAAGARYRSDLRPLFEDLPEPHPFSDAAPRPDPETSSRRDREVFRPSRVYGRVALGVCALAVVALAVVAKQPLLLLLVVGVVWFAPRRD